jgi:hypothetical protein
VEIHVNFRTWALRVSRGLEIAVNVNCIQYYGLPLATNNAIIKLNVEKLH